LKAGVIGEVLQAFSKQPAVCNPKSHWKTVTSGLQQFELFSPDVELKKKNPPQQKKGHPEMFIFLKFFLRNEKPNHFYPNIETFWLF